MILLILIQMHVNYINRSLGHLHLQKQRSLGKHRLKEYQRDKRYEYFADKKRNKGYVRHELPI